MWANLTKNWKTTLSGALTFLLGVPGVLAAIQAWAAGKPVDWKTVLVSIAMAAGGTGLMAAKDSTTHSTPEEVAGAAPKQ